VSWSYWFCDTITGEKLLQVEPASGSWSRWLNMGQSGSHTFSLGDGLISRADWRDATIPWARTLVICWEGDPVAARVVMGRPYDRNKQMLTVRHTDIRNLFLARYPFGENSYWEDEGAGIVGKLTIASKSLVSAFGIVLDAALTGPVGAADYTLPMTLPSLSGSGSYSAEYDNFNFQKVSDILDELQEMDGGPDSDFAPQWSGSDTLEWVARVGALTGGTFDFDLSDPACPVASTEVDEDAMRQVTGVFGVGAGNGPSMVVGGTPGVLAATIPARDDVVKWKMVKSNDVASSLAKEHVAAFRYPTVEPSFAVLASEVSPLDLVLGSTITVTDSGDPFLLDGPTDYRLIGFTGGVGLRLELMVQEVRS